MGDVVAPHTIEMPSGVYVDLLRPDPADIRLEDIAHNLSHVCRYGGSARHFYSVAEHACLVATQLRALGCDEATILAGLHHDDAEAYLGDIPRPLKPLLGAAYRTLTQRLDDAIYVALNMRGHDEIGMEPVKAADDWALAMEADQLLPSRGRGWPIVEEGGHREGDGAGLIRCWHPEEARRRYLHMHGVLVEAA